MMANLPVFQEIGANIHAGAGKPGVPVDGEGIDFSALLANVQTGAGDVPVAPATSTSQDMAPVMRVVPADERAGVISTPVELYPGEGRGPGQQSTPLVALDLGLRRGTVGFNQDETSAGPPDAAIPAATSPERLVNLSPPTKFAQGVSVLPQLVRAMTLKQADGTDAKPVDATDEDNAEAQDSDGDSGQSDISVKAHLTQGLALPLLQSVATPAAGNAVSVTKQSAAAQGDATVVTLARSAAFMRPPAALRQAAALPANAAAPAQLQAQRRLEGDNAPISLPQATGLPDQVAQTPEQAAPRADIHRQGMAFQQSATMPIAPAKGEGIIPAAHHGGAGTQSADDTAVQPVPVVSGTAPAAPVGSPSAAPLQVNVVAPALAMSPVADTAAMLGERVIDMGVDGQWIDRMAREIADISAGTGRASFSLNPENLGRLQVEILHGDKGADVRLIAETDAAATALSQGRHQLQQDARLQAVRINDVQIERSSDTAFSGRGQSMGQSMDQQQAGQQGQSHAFHKKPLIEAVSSMANGAEAEDRTASAPTPGRAARYA